MAVSLKGLIVDVTPDDAGVVFRSSDDGVGLIVESTREYFVIVGLQHLKFFASVRIPETRGTVFRCRKDFGVLTIESALGNTLGVTLQFCDASVVGHVVDAACAIIGNRDQASAGRVEGDIEDFILMTEESEERLGFAGIPHFAGFVQ